MQGVLRARKDGGSSICYAPENKVGKRRCCHVMSEADIKVNKVGSTSFINISGKVDGADQSFDIQASDTKIRTYIAEMSKALSKTEKDSILSQLRGM